ncbi:MAG: pyridoxal-dependent decarboxylase, exosortase A system-associated [Candidatus Accumulibacter sp. UW20]|jgi:diaminopimelate decarboxylase
MKPSALPPAVDWLESSAADWQSLARIHGTPFFFFDAEIVAGRIRAVRAALDGLAQIYFAVKANPNLGLLRALQPVADGVDISSGGELIQAQLAGYDPAAMSFAGPAKTTAELEAAIRAGVGCISAESVREIEECAGIAERLGRPARLLLRVNPAAPNRAYGLKMGGKPVQFGIDEEDLPDAEACLAAQARHLEFRGIHAYVGSQCFDPTAVVEATINAFRIAAEIERRSGLASRKINLGGGFGVAHSGPRRELDLAALADALLPVLATRKARTPACDLIFELGRYLTAEAGLYVTRVVRTKPSRGKHFVICDGGLNHQLAAAGTFGAALRGNFPVRNLTRPAATPVSCHIAGPSCNPTDLLGVDTRLPTPAEGDLIGVEMSGSYGLTASPLLFLGRPTPVELVRSAGEIVVGRHSHPTTDFN